ncbi:MAG: AAA family ATPase [Micromonosporaceae bacterium]
MVGRGPERVRLTGAWRRTVEGRAQFVLVTGEPGIGKTRLTEEFARWCGRRGAVVATARCYAAEGDLAYGPVVAWLRAPARCWPPPSRCCWWWTICTGATSRHCGSCTMCCGSARIPG